MIFNIQKCSVHDGKGLRTLVFFKGCPLRCQWCANPESQAYEKEISEIPRKCIGCQACVQACPRGAIRDVKGELLIDRSLCGKCTKCTEVCFAEAKTVVGKEMDVEELFHEIRKDKFFYDHSGGGVTFSGGEPLTQPKLLTEIARKCYHNRIDTAIETCGCGNYEEFKEALPFINYMFYDIKHMDSRTHKILTGAGNERILDNLKKICTHNIPITVRTPVIPGRNDSIENICATAEFISTLPNVQDYELLPYHNLGASKYTSLGVTYILSALQPPEDEKMRELVRAANAILMPKGKHCFYTRQNRKEIVTEGPERSCEKNAV